MMMLNDEYWSKLEEILPQESIDNKRNLRMTVKGILYRMRVSCPWRNLPQAFGCWNSIYKRFNAWALSRKWIHIFKALAIDLDWEWEFIDGRAMLKRKAIVREQRVKNLKLKAKSRAGNTTKIPFGS